MSNSEDEFEIECEEIVLSEPEEMDPLRVSVEGESEYGSTSNKMKQKIDDPKNLVPLRGISLNMLPDATKLKYIRRPTRPVRLFSFSDSDIMKRFSKTTEASKSLAMRLLDIVKSVNLRRPVKVENGVVVPNFYLLATQCEPQEGGKVTKLDSMDIVNLIKDIIHMIKIGVYRRVDFVDIICDSPAIFMIKYIHVKNWDAKMNAVYVVTSEYLLPYLCKIRAAEEEEEKAEKRMAKSKVQRDERYKKAAPKRKSTPEESKAPEKKKVVEKVVEVSNESVPKIEIITRTKKTTNTSLKQEPEPATNPESDVDTAQKILSKYLDTDAVNFFTIQMKSASSKANHRWSDEDKSFASKLYRANPKGYSSLLSKYSLPSEKLLEKYTETVKQNTGTGQQLRRSARKR